MPPIFSIKLKIPNIPSLKQAVKLNYSSQLQELCLLSYIVNWNHINVYSKKYVKFVFFFKNSLSFWSLVDQSQTWFTCHTEISPHNAFTQDNDHVADIFNLITLEIYLIPCSAVQKKTKNYRKLSLASRIKRSLSLLYHMC